MHFLSGKHMERRTFVRGMGASIALPFLDAMVPAGRLSAAKAAEVDPTRLVAIEMVHGAAGCNEWGASQNLWAPASAGRGFDLSPSALMPLDPWRDYLTIISNTDVRMAEAFRHLKSVGITSAQAPFSSPSSIPSRLKALMCS